MEYVVVVVQSSMKETNFGTAKLMTETMNIAAVLIALVGIVKALNNLGKIIQR